MSIINDEKALRPPTIIGSNCLCHKRYLALKARTLEVSEKYKKHSFGPLRWEAVRVAALLGIIDEGMYYSMRMP